MIKIHIFFIYKLASLFSSDVNICNFTYFTLLVLNLNYDTPPPTTEHLTIRKEVYASSDLPYKCIRSLGHSRIYPPNRPVKYDF